MPTTAASAKPTGAFGPSHRTGDDVTGFILSQILVEEAKKKNALLPAPLLHLIIRYGHGVLGEFFEKYLDLSIQSYLAYRSNFDDQFKQWLTVGMDLSAMVQKNFPPFNPMGSFFDFFTPPVSKEKG